ncbi:MAG: ABC transporter permease [Campylobacter sp.]|nr:ABC transporter permease [Campylobacter sp.]
MLNKNFINYAVKLLLKDKADHAFSFSIFAFIVFVLSSVLFISSSIQHDLSEAIKNQPSIVIEAFRAGKGDLMHEGYIYDIKTINGVSDAWGVVDGYYYFGQKRIWFHVVGDDELSDDEMIIGEGVKIAMAELYYKDEFNFLTENELINVKINKIAPHESSLFSNDLIRLSPATARRVLSLEEGEYTKIYADVPNPNEIAQSALSIANIYPNSQVLSIEDKIAEIKHMYYYKGGIFMVIYVVAMISFFILLKNQISLSYGTKRREIAILRSIGYAIKDIIALKFIQNFIVAMSAFLLSIALAYFYVFVLDAPFLREIFLGSNLTNTLTFTPIIDINTLFLIFLFSVIPFLAFVIIPSWQIAISDMSEAVK